MTGKEKCELMRNLRKNIAEKNNLFYTPRECHHEGDCPGYCPMCDKEAERLMNKLISLEAMGKEIKINAEDIVKLESIAANRPPATYSSYTDVVKGFDLMGDIMPSGFSGRGY